MSEIIKNLRLVWFVCYLQLVNTSFLSDNELRSYDCAHQCDENYDCSYAPNLICSERGTCECTSNFKYNESCLCAPCRTRCMIPDDCCRGSCINNLCAIGPSTNQDILLTATQIAMTGALILGIITIIALLWKMCSKTDYRSPAMRRNQRNAGASRRSGDSTASAGSLQRVVTARLRDAPPPYIRSSPLPPPGDTPPPYHLLPAQGYVNGSFEGEGNIPPPDYNVAVRLANENSEANVNSNASANSNNNTNENKSENEREQTDDKDKDKVVSRVPEGSSLHI